MKTTKDKYHICVLKEFNRQDLYYLQKRERFLGIIPLEFYFNEKGHIVEYDFSFKTTSEEEIKRFKQFILDVRNENN